MYEVKFYEDEDGNAPVKEYLEKLGAKKDKDSRVNFTKIRDYIVILSKYGTRAGEPYVKHIEGELWELRPLRNRILFFAYYENQLVLLSSFVKKTRKTPQKEIDRAIKLMNSYKKIHKEQRGNLNGGTQTLRQGQ